METAGHGRASPRFQGSVRGHVCFRILRFVQKEGGSPQAVALAVEDLHAFFRKLEGPLAEDLKAIFGEEAEDAENGH